MSARLRRNVPMLRLLCHSKPSVIKAVMKGASPDLLDSLSECSLNILKGNVRLTSAQKKRLTRHKQGLRALAKKGTGLKRRKQLLQKGGFLPALLSPVLGILGGLLGGR